MTPQVITKKILDAAMTMNNLQQFVKAVQAAGLEDTLTHEGPFTVFAPSDEAFEQLPADMRNDLLKPSNQQELMHVMACHVIPVEMSAEEVGYLSAVQSVNGNQLRISEDADGSIVVGAAHIIDPDIECSNGMLHIIDQVLLP